VSTAQLEPKAGPTREGDVELIELHLQRQLRGRVRNLRVSHGAHGLVLHGHASTYYAKQLAQHALMDATSLPLVSNEILVL
jgi:hypothetical protein